MTPEQLNDYLQVMRSNGVQAGALEIPWDEFIDPRDVTKFIQKRTLKMSFQFEPKMPDETAAPGGWKAPVPGAPAVQSDLQTRGLDEQQLPEIEL